MVLGFVAPINTQAQIDPVNRRLIEVGYDAALQGHAPIAAYGFFYYNQPEFYSTNLALRAAISPLYVDSELGLKGFIGPNTDLAFGLAGGGYADSYYEVRKGVYDEAESFYGDGAEVSSSIYHLFNPSQKIPLNLVFRVSARETLYRSNGSLANNFQMPDNRTTFRIRTGLRWGGQEPSLTEPLAMELSLWHQAEFRTPNGPYGFNGDREVRPDPQLVWGRALLKYMTEKGEQSFQLSLNTGTVWDADRFSAYRLGGLLPFISEFPLSIPGYFYEELSARTFGLLNAEYSIPLGPAKDWRAEILGASGMVDYLPGLEQPGHWHSGAGAGITYISPRGSMLVSLIYGHGFDAIRTHGRGADEVSLLFQYDFEARGRGKSRFFVPASTRPPAPGSGTIIP